MEPRGVGVCYQCGDTRNLEEHHIFYGQNNRKRSEHYGLKVHLCPGCHRYAGTGVHGGNTELDRQLKQAAQQIFEALYSHETFMEEFGKNYLTKKQEPRAEKNGFQWL